LGVNDLSDKSEWNSIASELFQPSGERSARVDVGCQSDDVSDSLSHELIVLKRLIAEHERTSSAISDARSLLGCASPRRARILQIIATNGTSFDLKRLSAICGKLSNFSIKVKTVKSCDFQKNGFNDWRYLRKTFDMIFIGGNDSAHAGLPDLTKDIIEGTFIQYHRKGGKLCFFHDIARGSEQDIERWASFEGKMGQHRKTSSGSDGKRFTRVSRKDMTGPPPAILTTPFELGDSFEVGETHSGQIYAAPNAILVGANNDCTYYIESEGICFCEAGHTSGAVTKDEYRFLVNVICCMIGFRDVARK
jgi:hypothetical protein